MVDTKNMTMEMLTEKWDGIIANKEDAKIEDNWKRKVTLRLLENQEQALLTEAPVNVAGGNQAWDPVMISMIRRNTP
jgi:hypothetical protein